MVLSLLRRCQRGAAAVEFALVLPMVSMLLLGAWAAASALLDHMDLDSAAAAEASRAFHGALPNQVAGSRPGGWPGAALSVSIVDCAGNPSGFPAGCGVDPNGRYARIIATSPAGHVSRATIRIG